MKSEISPEQILELFEARNGGKPRKSYSLPDLLSVFGDRGKRRRQLEAALSELVSQGRLVRVKGPAYVLPDRLKQVQGHLSIQRQGMGFVRVEGHTGQDIYIHPTQLGAAWNGDRVLIALLPGQSGKNLEGRVLEVLERSRKELVVLMLAQVVKENGILKRLARPLDSRLTGYLLVDPGELEHKPRENDLVFVRLEDAASQKHDGAIRAMAVTDFGRGGPLAMYERLVKTNHDIPVEFPPAVQAEAAALPADPDPETVLSQEPARRDLRDLPLVTIDGSDARDYDDAICVKRGENGFTLWVAIADVACYVLPGSAIDFEALGRGNSCYFPASVEPMLPEVLSNGLCSLRPDQPRLAMVAEIGFTTGGVEKKSSFYPALIQSKARLVYEDVENALEKGIAPASFNGTLPMLQDAAELARALISRRDERGTLDFDLPEARAELDKQGNVTGITAREHLFSHKLIEEFMIAANEAVARFLASHQGIGFLYRVHPAPDPDKLRELMQVLERGGLVQKVPDNPGPADLQKLLDDASGTPQEFVVNRLLLRSLMQARYSPVPEGHFGLASSAYCHFTSPIRRYADLTVHRALRHVLGMGGTIPGAGVLAQISDDLNGRERAAIEAEREIYKICAAIFLQPHLDEEFRVVIAGLSSFGLFVELEDPPAEGFIRISSLPDDYYEYKQDQQILLGQRTGIIFRMGQALDAVLVEADPVRQQISFELAPGQGFGKSRSAVRKTGKAGNSDKKQRPKKCKTFQKGAVRVRGSRAAQD